MMHTNHRQVRKSYVILEDNQDPMVLTLFREKFIALPSFIRPGTPIVKKVRFRGSGPDELIQLADMIVGAYGAFLDGETEWFDPIRNHSEVCLMIP
jgi:hypothetical protein